MPRNKKQGQGAPKRSLPLSISQNYLTSAVVLHNILRRTTLSKNDHVLEIGPGKGHITELLLQRCGYVTAVELDDILYHALRVKFAEATNLRLVHLDFLKYRLPERGRYKIFANIPFNRTSDILRKLTESKNPPEDIWLVVEKGAAKRFMGRPQETKRSLLIKPFYDMQIVYYFQRQDFHPAPGVDAVLLHLNRKQQPDISVKHRYAYERFITEVLRYTTSKKSNYPNKYAGAAKKAGISLDFTLAHILYVQWLCLFRRCTGLGPGP